MRISDQDDEAVEVSEREAFYDAEIGPALMDLARRCQAKGLSLVAAVEWEPGETGSTRALLAGAGAGIRMTELCTRANGNVDSFMFALMRHAREHGHSSVVLAKLGVPAEGCDSAAAAHSSSETDHV